MATRNFEDPDIIWNDIHPDFLKNITPGRYVLRKRSETDTRFYAVLTVIQEDSTGRGLQLFVNDLREFFFLDGPPTWEYLSQRLPSIVHPGRQVARSLQCDCLIHNYLLFNTVEMGRGKLKGDWKANEKEVMKQFESINQTILREYDCFVVDQYGDTRKQLMDYFQVIEAVRNPNKGKKGATKRKADEKEDDNDNAKKMKTSEEPMDS